MNFTKDIAQNLVSRYGSKQEAMKFFEGCDGLDNQWDRNWRENNHWNWNEHEGQTINSNIQKGDQSYRTWNGHTGNRVTREQRRNLN